MKRRARQVGAGLLVGVIVAAAALGFGIRNRDVARLRDFGDAVRRWQQDPDFRQVQREYVTLGVEAMRATWWGVSGEQVVMAFRSLPGLPLYLAASDGSAAHYRAFAHGELSAYLHLAGEQGVADGVAMIEELGRREALTDADIVAFLRGFKLPVPVATDAGAVASVRRLLADTQSPPRPFEARGDVAAALGRHLGDVEAMTRDQQRAAMRELDDVVRTADPELWRTKQVSDFLGGIWAQAYGRIYLDGIEWVLTIRRAARAVLVTALVAVAALLVRLRRGTHLCGRAVIGAAHRRDTSTA